MPCKVLIICVYNKHQSLWCISNLEWDFDVPAQRFKMQDRYGLRRGISGPISKIRERMQLVAARGSHESFDLLELILTPENKAVTNASAVELQRSKHIAAMRLESSRMAHVSRKSEDPTDY